MAAAEAAASSSSVMETDTKMKYVCTYCDIQTSSAAGLGTHVIGILHRRKMAEECPAMFPHIMSLQHFLDTYLKDDAILGLEHVVEVQVGSYLYICRLCSVIMIRACMINHLCGFRHLERYFTIHYPKALYFQTEFAKRRDKKKSLRCQAAELHRQWGRKKMKELKIDAKGPTPAKVARHASNENDLSSKSNAFPRGMSGFPLRDRWKCLNDTPFKHNEEFVDYMRHFEIQNDEDAAFVKIVIQNCNQALTKFQGEQANVAVAQGSSATGHQATAPTGRADPECVSHSPETVDESVPVASQGADSPSLEPEIFFRNIKNMEASQVRSVFEKIAATHPAFRGINLQNVIRYLQETGRVKNPDAFL